MKGTALGTPPFAVQLEPAITKQVERDALWDARGRLDVSLPVHGTLVLRAEEPEGSGVAERLRYTHHVMR